ncbi:MAG: transglycosylase domain-containing protein, partial [Oscillospiraceae bacterium]|nr:transglycosylase domain-containing protein [Oscillospiraceae bacterium]
MNLFKACADWLSAHTLSALAAIGRETWDFLAGIKAAVFSIPWRIAAWLAGIGFAVANIPIRIKGLFGDVRRDGLSAALEIRHNDKRRRQVALARRDQPPRRLADEPEDDFPAERRPLWKRMVVGLFVFIGRTLATVAVSLVVTGCIVGITALLFVLTKLDRDPGFDINQIKINYASVIFVQNPATGEYDEFKKLHASENREWVDYDQIPQSMKDAVVSIEDKRFWEHNGVDWRRTGFALINMFTNQR